MHQLDVFRQLDGGTSCRQLVLVKSEVDDPHRVELHLGLHTGVSCGVQTLQAVIVQLHIGVETQLETRCGVRITMFCPLSLCAIWSYTSVL